jgi:hypothetical protein
MEKNKGGRPRNPVTDDDFKKYLKKCAKLDLPKIRARLMDIALGNAKDEHFDSKTGQLIKKAAPLSVCIEAMSIYLGKVFSKIEADAKTDTNIKVTHSVTDALKEVEAKKRAEYEKKHQKELEAKEAGKLAKRVING